MMEHFHFPCTNQETTFLSQNFETKKKSELCGKIQGYIMSILITACAVHVMVNS